LCYSSTNHFNLELVASARSIQLISQCSLFCFYYSLCFDFMAQWTTNFQGRKYPVHLRYVFRCIALVHTPDRISKGWCWECSSNLTPNAARASPNVFFINFRFDEHAPVFAHPSYKFEIPDIARAPVGHIIGQVKATDSDDGDHGKVVYTLLNDSYYFSE